MDNRKGVKKRGFPTNKTHTGSHRQRKTQGSKELVTKSNTEKEKCRIRSKTCHSIQHIKNFNLIGGLL